MEFPNQKGEGWIIFKASVLEIKQPRMLLTLCIHKLWEFDIKQQKDFSVRSNM